MTAPNVRSSILVATPAPTQLPTIYRAGDIIIQNPQETCVIFVTVILFSAFLEYFLQRISNVENRYARVLVTTMSQEVTIVGVLALFLMFSISVVPQRLMKPLYVQLFNWANISLFFLAVMFVVVIVIQFAWAAVETRFVWKAFEEGALETEELDKLKYPHRMFKLIHDLYRQELQHKSGLPTSSVPLNEYTALIWRRSLVRCSNLTFRTWFFLSFVILLNLIRIIFIPWAKGLSGNDLAFFNQLTLMGVIGWGMFLSYVFFFCIMQHRLNRLATGKIVLAKDEPAYTLIPCGTLKRAIEYLQILIFSYNWYIVLFITGGYRQVVSLDLGWQKAVLMFMFWLPMILITISLPWCFHSMAMLQVIGNVQANIVLGIFRKIRGEGENESGDDNDDEVDDEAAAQLEEMARQIKLGGGAGGTAKGSDRGSASGKSHSGKVRPGGARASDAVSATGRLGGLDDDKKDRPNWADDDDDWNGDRTLAFGERRNEHEKKKIGTLYMQNVDAERVRRQLAAQFESERVAMEASRAPPPPPPEPEEPVSPVSAKKAPVPGKKAAASKPAAKAPVAKAPALTAEKKKEIEEAAKKELERRKKERLSLRKASAAKKKKAAMRPGWVDSDEEWDEEEGLTDKHAAEGGGGGGGAHMHDDEDDL